MPKMEFKWAKMKGIWKAQEAQLAMREKLIKIKIYVDRNRLDYYERKMIKSVMWVKWDMC